MTPTQLNEQNLATLSSRLSTPLYDRSATTAGIVHIGVGGFHRSHQAYYIHQLLRDGNHSDWAICGIGLREGDRTIANVLAAQDGLYTLITQHPDGKDTCEVIGSIVDYIYAVEDPQQAIDRMAHADTKIVSLTITEGGYNFNPSTGDFNFDNTDVQHELQHPDQPRTVFGYLAAALRQRRAQGLPAFTVLSCDNIQHNGDVARKMLLSFLERLDTSLYEWVQAEVRFPNSMVDRITPVTPPSAMDYLSSTYQLHDDWPIVCEPYIQWVVEDSFSNGRPPLEQLGVQFVPDVTPYEKMKIRLLNAGHSVLGIPGAVHGHTTINACMEDEVFAQFMRQFMDVEVTPLLGNIEGIDLTEYKDSLEQRFSNPNIKDGVSRICSESSAKLPKFLIPTIQENLATGGSIAFGTFVLAAWAFYSHMGVDMHNTPIEIIDQRAQELHQNAKAYADDPLSFLRITDIFGSLADDARFAREYTDILAAIHKNPDVREHMNAVMGG